MDVIYTEVGSLGVEDYNDGELAWAHNRPIYECQSCFALVRDQERHTQWHLRQSVSHIVSPFH